MDMMGGKQLLNKVFVLFVIAAAVAGAALGGLWLLPPGDADASGHSATRSFSAMSVAPGEDGDGDHQTPAATEAVGRIVDTVPSGFTVTERLIVRHLFKAAGGK